MEAAARRTGVLASHLAAEPCAASASPPAGGVGSPPSPDDVVICGAVRTAITKAKKGGFRDTPAEDLLAAVLRALVERTGVNPALLGDVIVGTVLGSNVWRANQARIAMLLAGYPDSARARPRWLTRHTRATPLTRPPGPLQVPVRIINRQCSSGLQAVADVAASIKARGRSCVVPGRG